jgi:hypothetical protein
MDEESEGFGRFGLEDDGEIGFHSHKKECKSAECDCDGSCPNFVEKKSLKSYFNRENINTFILVVLAICFFFFVYFFRLS